MVRFIEIIEWRDSTSDTILYYFPVKDEEIKNNAVLTVRESQIALFMNEGKIADVFNPGRYYLNTKNLPILTKLLSWKYDFESPFKAEVYFINTKQFVNQKWGTSNPIMMEDSEFGIIRLRCHGVFSFRVTDAKRLFLELSGTSQSYTTDKVYSHLRSMIVSCVSDTLGESKISALNLASNYEKLSILAKNKLEPNFQKFGISLASLFIENISLPEEVEKYIDKKTSMKIIDDMHQYTQFQTAEAIKDAANNPSGGTAAIGLGFAAGAVLGKEIMKNMETANQSNQKNEIECKNCKTSISATAKFCPECGNPILSIFKCSNCGNLVKENAKFCPECGNKL